MTFVGLDGRQLSYCVDEYNASATNERAVEVPIALDWIGRQAGTGLEVGNVLSHYQPADWPVIDRDETAPGVMNIDVCHFRPEERFDWIVSISTLEHVGWDDTPRDAEKALAAVAHLRSLLTPTGRLLLTFPTGHHPGLDEAAASGIFDPVASVLMLRTDDPAEREVGSWEPAPFRSVPYLHRARSAGAVWIAVL